MNDAGTALPSTWNWFDTLGVMVAGSWLFAYSYCITFIAGEVKRPDKSILLGNLFAILVPAFFMLWLAIVLYRVVGFEFLSATAWVDYNGLEGYTVPWSTHYVGLAAMLTKSPLLLFMMAGSFILFNIWYVALSYLAFPRIVFEIGIAIYAFWQNPMTGLSITALEVISVFGVTAIAAIIFPYVKKAKNIWEASPYKTWKFLGLPVVTWGGIVNVVYLVILFYFYVVMPGFEEFTAWSLVLYAVIWGLGIAWFFYWKRRNKDVGVDVSMTYGELPPD
jgi:hypothetical protein